MNGNSPAFGDSWTRLNKEKWNNGGKVKRIKSCHTISPTRPLFFRYIHVCVCERDFVHTCVHATLVENINTHYTLWTKIDNPERLENLKKPLAKFKCAKMGLLLVWMFIYIQYTYTKKSSTISPVSPDLIRSHSTSAFLSSSFLTFKFKQNKFS